MSVSAAPPGPVAGRAAELDRLTTLVEHVAGGHGQTIALVGEPGIGKTRLVRAALADAEGRGLTAVVGRCVPGALVAYRPVREALLSWTRVHGMPAEDAARPWLRGLGLVPDDRPDDRPVEPGSEPVSPLYVGEALLRLVDVRPRGTLVVLEDLHWADSETISVAEYLADHVHETRCSLVLTARPGESGAADHLLHRLRTRGAAPTLRLPPLSPEATGECVAARLGEVPDAVRALLHSRSGGNPLLLGELLDELASVPADELEQRATSTLPASVRESVTSRLAEMSAQDVLVMQTAALVGTDDLRVLSATTRTTEDETLAALLSGVTHRILDADPARGGSVQFRHELVREVVLAALGPVRRSLARRALDVVLPDDLRTVDDEALLETIVRLGGQADDPETAARAALRGGVLAFDRWALAAAERWLTVARTHAGTDVPLVNAIDLVQLRVAASAGRGVVVRRLGEALTVRLGDDEHEARLEVLLRLAQAAADEGRAGEARALLGRAEPLLPVVADACSDTKHRLTSAVAALADADVDLAACLAGEARRLAASHPDQRDLECSALAVSGQALWPDVSAARSVWQEGLALASAHGMRLWRGRLQLWCARADVADLSGDEALREARTAAHEAGAPVLGARVAALEAELALLRWHPDDVRRLLAEAERQLENVTAPAGLRSALDALADLLLVLEGGTTDRTPAAVVLADLLSGGEPSVAVTGGTTVEAALGEIARLSPDAPRGLGLVVDTIHAVADRLAADPADGGLALPEAVTTLAGAPWLGAVLVLRGAPAALAGGSSAPLRDALREAIDILDDLPGGTTAAERCRDLIRRAGAAYPRRTSAQAGVPPGLQRRGITAREWQVLTLVGEGLTSREIAQRLYLSPRTVEKHVERMLGKTGAANRAALAALSAAEDVT